MGKCLLIIQHRRLYKSMAENKEDVTIKLIKATQLKRQNKI